MYKGQIKVHTGQYQKGCEDADWIQLAQKRNNKMTL